MFRKTLLCLATALLVSACSGEDARQLTAPEAFEQAQAGEITLIDIRRPDEWKQTGLARDVVAIDMNHPQGIPGFAKEVARTVNNDLDAPIVLICRTGNRSSRMAEILSETGFTNVKHIPEGMLGSSDGPGWVARGLPVEPCAQC